MLDRRRRRDRPAAPRPTPTALADAVVALAGGAGSARARLAGAARRAAVAERTWDRALERLADGYRRALGEPAAAARGGPPCRLSWRSSKAAPRAPGAPRLRARRRAPLRVADVALFYGERSGGIRTYLDAKAEHAVRTGEIDHHVLVPGARGAHAAAATSCPRCASWPPTATASRSARAR